MNNTKIAIYDKDLNYFFTIFEKKPLIGKIISLPLQKPALTERLSDFNTKVKIAKQKFISLHTSMKAEDANKEEILNEIKHLEENLPKKPFIKKQHYETTKFRVISFDGNRTILEPLNLKKGWVVETNKS